MTYGGGEPMDVRAEIEVVRAHSRRVRRRRAVRRTLAISVAIVLLAAGAVLATDALHLGSGEPRSVADRTPFSVPTTTPVTELPRAACRSPLDTDDPLRLWIGGDSLAGSLGPALGELAAATGVAAPTFDSRVSSGLATPEFFDWPQHATEEMARLDPEVAVFIIGTNDYNIPRSQPVDASGEPTWKASYRLLVEQMIDVLDGEDGRRPVYWIGAPTMQDRRKDDGVRAVNEVARSVVEQHDDASYVDAYALFAGSDGKYAATLPDADGKSERVRTADGVHFTPAGGDRLGEAVFALLDTRCRLTEQQVEGREQPVVQAPGSGQLPGTHRGTTTPTSPPATAPPATAPTAPTTAPTTTPTTVLPPVIKP